MKAYQIKHIKIKNEPILETIETHISWVLLTKQYVYKIKKPVRFSFLDFSTLQKRKHFCEEELQLNKRLTEDMYLAVVPIMQDGEDFFIEKNEGNIVDYAIKMKRIPASKHMHLLLKQNKITHHDIEQVAKKLASFHQNAPIIKRPFDLLEMKENFNDIKVVQDFIKKELDPKWNQVINDSILFSNQFLEENSEQFKFRIQRGMIRDGHGDLHSSNIFIDGKPIIFDCIEFNPKFREIDILNDIAFLCIDLDAFDYQDLRSFFIRKYQQQFPEVIESEFDHKLLMYYKLYRVNVRVKVKIFKLQQLPERNEKQQTIAEIEKYLKLMKSYLTELHFLQKTDFPHFPY